LNNPQARSLRSGEQRHRPGNQRLVVGCNFHQADRRSYLPIEARRPAQLSCILFDRDYSQSWRQQWLVVPLV
jgi:hypothetical protein